MSACQFLLLVCLLVFRTNAQSREQPAYDLAQRILPDSYQYFSFALDNGTSEENDAFSIGQVQCIYDKDADWCIQVTGNSILALTSGFHYYLKHVANIYIGWNHNQTFLTTPLPWTNPESQTIQVTSPYKFRYHFNVVTFGYSTVWWDFPRWSREIDWLALQGVNLPLAMNGQELVWLKVFQNLGLSDVEILADWFGGPAHQPWFRMGNLDAWGNGVNASGNPNELPMAFITQQSTLQVQILERMRSFGMKPILPAFAGHVPPALKKVFPTANITQLSAWKYDPQSFPGTFFLSPSDPLFKKIATAFIVEQKKLYGTDSYYSCDVYNEIVPLSKDPKYLQGVSKAIYEGMSDGDPSSVWVMQAWFLVNSKYKSFWGPPQIKAFLSTDSVPLDNLIMLDLWAEIKPVWNQTDSFYGRNFIWCMLNNFGLRTGLYGALDRVNQGPSIAAADNPYMIGTGMAMEAIGENYIAFDLMSDLGWFSGPLNLSDWLVGYVNRVVGNDVTSLYPNQVKILQSAYTALVKTIYQCPTEQGGTSGMVLAARPSLNLTSVSCCDTLTLYYDPKDLDTLAFQPMLDAVLGMEYLGADIGTMTVLTNDLTRLALQVVSDSALDAYYGAVAAFQSNDTLTFEELSQTFGKALECAAMVTKMEPSLLVSGWMQQACDLAHTLQVPTGLAQDLCVSWQVETTDLITLWGGIDSGLHDYSYRVHYEMINTFYTPRWDMFYKMLSTNLKNGITTVDQALFESEVRAFEWAFVNGVGWDWQGVPSPVDLGILKEISSRG